MEVREVSRYSRVVVHVFVLPVTSFVLLYTVHTCLLLRNLVAVHSQDSICTCKPHAVLAVHCNYMYMYMHMYIHCTCTFGCHESYTHVHVHCIFSCKILSNVFLCRKRIVLHWRARPVGNGWTQRLKSWIRRFVRPGIRSWVRKRHCVQLSIGLMRTWRPN